MKQFTKKGKFFQKSPQTTTYAQAQKTHTFVLCVQLGPETFGVIDGTELSKDTQVTCEVYIWCSISLTDETMLQTATNIKICN